MNTNFGEHLMLDGYIGNKEVLSDKTTVTRFLNEMSELLGMTPIIEPIIKWCDGNDIKDPGGWSGIVMIAESHISAHTFPNKGFVSIDVYTCQNGLKTEKIESYVKEVFTVKEIELNFVKHGIKYSNL